MARGRHHVSDLSVLRGKRFVVGTAAVHGGLGTGRGDHLVAFAQPD